MTSGTKRRFAWISWLGDDLRRVGALLRQRETWVFIGITVAFGILGGISLYFATGLDFAMQLRNLRRVSCATASNLQSAAIIIGGTAFFLAGIAALGELATYLDNRKLQRQHTSARSSIVVSAIALAAGGALLWLLLSICG